MRIFGLLLVSWMMVAGWAVAAGSFIDPTLSLRPTAHERVNGLDQRVLQATAWRGERVNGQIVLWGADAAVQARAVASDLESTDGHRIGAGLVRLDFLKFIEMNTRDGYAADPSHVERVPDMLNGSGPVTVPAGELQPLWVGVDVPRDAEPGLYRGKVAVRYGSQRHVFGLEIEVLPLTVPAVEDWAFDVDYWMHPQATLHYYLGCKGRGQDPAGDEHMGCSELLWSDQHLAWYRPTLELLRDVGVKTITVNLVKDPWRSAYRMQREQQQTNYSYDELIKWRRKADGSFSFDFRHFEKYVRFCMELGIDREIECFSMLPWIHSQFSAVTCYDEASGQEVIHYFESWEEYDQVWTSFMEAFVPVLVKNGWFDKTRIGADERGLGNMGHVEKVLNKFKHEGKALRISAAANKTHAFDDRLYYISMHGGISKIVNDQWTDAQFAEWAQRRRAKGLKSTWYTCTGTYPGNFGNSRPAESLFIGWYSAKIGADGYLRWAVDSWNDEPTVTTDHKVFETGDTFQIYPGDRDAAVPFTRSSVRLELFRQGVVDYEKMRVLKEQFPQAREAIAELLQTIERPQRPPQIEGNSSLRYAPETERDFSAMLVRARLRLLEITRDVLR
ncbi:DUF4091 domain-containing protein [Sulfuriroseicoccus oceanibius]|uniref:DUF4091 domain-containing protein n=1 Tax=Sulfuriroseicoccus oceanibius TaxID=2707525 RepID=A0A6B3LBA0_9BACT|nr:DUF4091 domain-containing protein [Sulfuriroseicoccus oceanibius]QQL45543.1 DUF4091 domain-containing protein [Sulfuriroseicoccus oceanibius]